MTEEEKRREERAREKRELERRIAALGKKQAWGEAGHRRRQEQIDRVKRRNAEGGVQKPGPGQGTAPRMAGGVAYGARQWNAEQVGRGMGGSQGLREGETENAVRRIMAFDEEHVGPYRRLLAAMWAVGMGEGVIPADHGLEEGQLNYIRRIAPGYMLDSFHRARTALNRNVRTFTASRDDSVQQARLFGQFPLHQCERYEQETLRRLGELHFGRSLLDLETTVLAELQGGSHGVAK